MNNQKVNGILLENNARNKEIVKVSIVGIIANIFLAIFKAIIGFITGSIAIVLDAVNNTTDVASSVVTIVGTKLANKKPDKKHPFGHGRVEYLTAMVISLIVLYAGMTSLIESIKKVINPTIPKYTIISLIIVTVAVIVKIILGEFVKKKGELLNSQSLVNSGQDAKLDAVISLSTLIAAIIFIFTKIPLEAYLGIIISLIIIKAGIDMIKEAISSVLGERVDPELINDIKKIIIKYEDVKGVYDLVLNNYGPNTYTGSVHIEVLDTMDIDEIDVLQRKITQKVYEETNVYLTAIGIYSVNTKNKKVLEVKNNINKILKKYDNILQYHGLYVDEEEKTIRFDIVMSFEEKEKEKLYNDVYNNVANEYKDYKIFIVVDTDFSVSK